MQVYTYKAIKNHEYMHLSMETIPYRYIDLRMALSIQKKKHSVLHPQENKENISATTTVQRNATVHH